MKSTDNEKYTRYSVFSAAGKLFGLELSKVMEVLQPPEVTKIPNMRSHVLGVYNLRGKIITLVDIRQILGLNQIKDTKSDMVILLKNADFTISFRVDRVLDFVEIKDSEIQPAKANIPSSIARYLKGIYQEKSMGEVYVFETDKLLNAKELLGRKSR